MTDPAAEPRYSVEDAFPEWKLPVDPIEIRVGPEGQTAVRLVLFGVGHDTAPAARWIRITSHSGQIGVELLDDKEVADWAVVSTGVAP